VSDYIAYFVKPFYNSFRILGLLQQNCSIKVNPRALICIGVDFMKLGASEPSHYAIQMSSVAGQSFAIGNLGKVGGRQVYA
jgi:hypothetical protein